MESKLCGKCGIVMPHLDNECITCSVLEHGIPLEVPILPMKTCLYMSYNMLKGEFMEFYQLEEHKDKVKHLEENIDDVIINIPKQLGVNKHLNEGLYAKRHEWLVNEMGKKVPDTLSDLVIDSCITDHENKWRLTKQSNANTFTIVRENNGYDYIAAIIPTANWSGQEGVEHVISMWLFIRDKLVTDYYAKVLGKPNKGNE